MYFLIILFFGSLLGIAFMIGRKLIMLQNGQTLNEGEILFDPLYLEKWKQVTVKNTKKHGYTSLVVIIRFYFRSINFFENKYQEVKNKIKEIHQKRQKRIHGGKKEVNSFLKMVSEYKNKIRKIKEKVKEEENL